MLPHIRRWQPVRILPAASVRRKLALCRNQFPNFCRYERI